MSRLPEHELALARTILTIPNGFTVRPNRPGDESSAARHANNRKIWLNLTDRFPHPYTEEDAKWWINHTQNPENWLPTVLERLPDETDQAFKIRQETSKIPADYGICHNDQYIGSIGLIRDPTGQPHILKLGYWLGEEYWGHGLMTQVVTAFVRWAFDTFPWLLRFEVDAYGWNPGSQKVLKKAGFQYEGTKKYRCFKDGKYTDLVEFSMLRPGWQPLP